MKKRRILYVDVTVTNNITKISLYDTGNNLTNILELLNVKDNNIAEQYAVLYAILYIIKHNYSNCHILSDNVSATKNKKILNYLDKNKINLSWIPREINIVADRITKLDPTVKVKEWYILNAFYKLVLK